MQEHLPAEGRVRWSALQRYIFLERRLFWEGKLNRSDLMEKFSISAPQASADIDNYKQLAPDSVEYDKSAKVFYPTDQFAPQFIEPDARQYLTQLLMMADDALGEGDSWLGAVPDHAAVAKVRRKMDVSTLRRILLAIHQRKAIQILYQSMSSAEPRLRWIAPHALGFDGSRWHARSWCFERSVFSDFVIARVLRVEEEQERAVDSSLDREWHTEATLRLGPHPKLSPEQRKVIELDYGMVDGEKSVTMRLSLAWYFERNLCLDLERDLEIEIDPKRVQVILLNHEEIEAMRKRYSLRRRD